MMSGTVVRFMGHLACQAEVGEGSWFGSFLGDVDAQANQISLVCGGNAIQLSGQLLKRSIEVPSHDSPAFGQIGGFKNSPLLWSSFEMDA